MSGEKRPVAKSDASDGLSVPLTSTVGSATIDQTPSTDVTDAPRNASLNRETSWMASRYITSVVENPLHKHARGGNLSELLDLLEEEANIDEVDDHGNTALMLSAKYDHKDILKVLIKRGAKICHKNHEEEDLFGIAVLNKGTDILKVLVETMMDVGLASQNEDDNVVESVRDALCEAASMGFCEKIELLSKLNPNMNVCDKEGNTLFHYASKANKAEVIETFGHILDINVQNDQTGDTPLHVACKHASHEAIIALLSEKVNVGIANEVGDNALHCFTRAIVRSTGKEQKHMQVLEEFIDRWVKSWLVGQSIHVPQTKADYYVYKRQAVHMLMKEMTNGDNETVLGLAFKIGSVPVIEKTLNLDNVMRFEHAKHCQYDVTHITPRTNSSANKTPKRKKSYLELLIENNPNQTISQILDIGPLKKIEVMYSSMTTLIYLIIIFLHALYMSLFSYSSIVLMDRIREPADADTLETHATKIIFYGVVPIEPLFFIIALVYRFHCAKTTEINVNFLTPAAFLMQCFSIIHHVIYVCLVTALIYQYFTMNLYNLHNTLSVTLLIGWLTTLSFTQGLKPIRFFWRMILHMIAVDVYKILFIYVFVLLSFSFALHVQFQISTPIIHTYPTPFHTMFMVFRMMVGMGELFDGEFENNIKKAGGSLALPIILFIIYIVLSSIILLNLLIAMMNTSYSDILTNLKLSRRIETLQRAINLEITVPWLTKLISRRVIRCGRVDCENGRLVPAIAAPDGLVWFVESAKKSESSKSDTKHQSNVAMEQILSERMNVLEKNVIEQLGLLQNRLDDIQRELLSQRK